MAKLLGAAGTLFSVIQVVIGIGEVTYSGTYDPSRSDCALSIASGSIAKVQCYDPASAPLLVPYAVEAGASFYFHGKYRGPNINYGPVILQCVDTDGYPWIQVTQDMNLQYNSGTGPAPAWTTLGTSPFLDALQDIDIKVDIATSGPHTVELLINQVGVIGPVTFTAAGLTNLTATLLRNDNVDSQYQAWSQMVHTENLSTVGSQIGTIRGTAAGTDQQWAGDVTGVNSPITSDANPNQATSAGLSQTYEQSSSLATVPAGYEILSIFNWIRGKNGGETPLNITSICRPGSTDYITGDLPGAGVGYASLGARYDVSPDTSAPWTGPPAQLGFGSAA